MAAVDLDRQAIERRDFPIGRRGYDTAAVDAHLQALAAEFEQLQRAAAGGGGDVSLAATAGSRVQSIIEAAETAAADIERQALETAQRVSEEAERGAARTREEAIAKARVQVDAVTQAAAALLQRVGSMDGEVGALIESLRAGAGRLAEDLGAVERGMSELYDAASGRERPAAGADLEPRPSGAAAEGAPTSEATQAPSPTAAPVRAAEPAPPIPAPRPPAAAPPPAAATPPAAAQAPAATGGDLDGARLIALNMALNGESRAATERYLAENYQLADRSKLVEEVYAAIEA
jgi:DivIVA domain-containing protein